MRVDIDMTRLTRPLAAALLAASLAGCDGELPFDVVGDEAVRELGLETWRQMRAERPPSDDPRLQQALDAIGARLLSAAGADPRAWEMVVFEGQEANAFALPGNKIGVYEGMFAAAANPDQMAAVVGHEIGHHLAEHSHERVNHAAVKEIGLNLVGMVLGLAEVPYSREIAALLGLGVEVGIALPYSREQEHEADRLGLSLMAEAGFDPRQAPALWRRMAELSQGQADFLSTHPAPLDRAERLEQILRGGAIAPPP